MIARLPGKKWFSIHDFIYWIHKTDPDFQRSSGEYKTWLIKNKVSDEFLTGFEHWFDVEGRLAYYFLTGPFFWLGILDLALDEGEEVVAFRRSNWAEGLLNIKPINSDRKETSEITLHQNGIILVPFKTQREIIYQIARFCKWEERQLELYKFRISPLAIQRAKAQNITTKQIQALFQKYVKKPAPMNIIDALGRWDKNRSNIKIERYALIRVASSTLLDHIVNSNSKRFICERLNGSTALIRIKDLQRFSDAVLELGYFIDISEEV
jgi:hypothetical protein